MARAVDDVDLVAALDEHRRPAGAAVEGLHPVEALAAAAVDEHDRIRLGDLDGLLPLDVHGPAHDGAVRALDPLDAGPEEAAARGHGIRRGHRTTSSYSSSVTGSSQSAGPDRDGEVQQVGVGRAAVPVALARRDVGDVAGLEDDAAAPRRRTTAARARA